MKRPVLVGAVLVAVAACTATSPDRPALKMLPEEGPPPSYAALLTRARAQATMATEAFYDNRWTDLEEAAGALEQTARFLPKAADTPAAHKPSLEKLGDDLGKEATKLRTAARSKDEKEVTAVMSRVNLKVRELRLEP